MIVCIQTHCMLGEVIGLELEELDDYSHSYRPLYIHTIKTHVA